MMSDVNIGTREYGVGTRDYPIGTRCVDLKVQYTRNGLPAFRKKACFRRKQSKPESGCLLFKKDIRNILITKARGAAPVKGVRSHTTGNKAAQPGVIIQRRTDVRIGKGVIDALHDLVLTHCEGKFAMAVLDSTVEAWASTFNATNSRKVHGRSTIKMAHYEAGERAASRLLKRTI